MKGIKELILHHNDI